MTLIAGFEVQGSPILFGDLLISGVGEFENLDVAVPAIGPVGDFFGGSGWAIWGLRQKIVIISDCCAVAWAGSFVGARIAIDRLRSMAMDRLVKVEEIVCALRDDLDLILHPIDLIGWVVEESGVKKFEFGEGVKCLESDLMGTVCCAGSGQHVIYEFVEMLKNSHTTATEDVAASDKAMSVALNLAVILLRVEKDGGIQAPTLRAIFGGGYEIAGYVGGKFLKLSDFTFVLWRVEIFPGKRTKVSPQLIVKQAYLDDVLLIRSAIFGIDERGRPALVDEQAHAVLPVYDSQVPLPSDLRDFSLQSNLFCHCFFCSHNGEVSIFTSIQRTSDEQSSMLLKDGENYLNFEVAHELIRKAVGALLGNTL